MERRPRSVGSWKDVGRLFTGCDVHCSCWKRIHTVSHSTLSLTPPLLLTTVMSSRGTSTLAFEVACFSEHILNFVSCVVCFLVALPVSLLMRLTAVSGATTTTQEHRIQKKQTNQP